MASRATVLIQRLTTEARLPEPMTIGAAGADCYADIGFGESVILRPGERAIISLGFAAAVPPGFEMQLRPRSGLAAKKGLTLLNSPGTIDSDYRGQVGAILINHSEQVHVIKHSMRICQAVIAAVPEVAYVEVDQLDDTERGEGGYGSSGE